MDSEDQHELLQRSGYSLDEMKFHWDKWKEESKAFWGRAVLGTALLLVSILFQFGIVSICIPGIRFTPPDNPRMFYGLIAGLSWFLWAFLCFKFIDLLRHRVPENLEKEVHTNNLPNPLHDYLHVGPQEFLLKKYGRLSYLIFLRTRPRWPVCLWLLQSTSRSAASQIH